MESSATNGGDGPNSYSKNSTYQRAAFDGMKALIDNFIKEKLEIRPSDVFRIADLGCSVGSITFMVVDNILEAVEIKYKSHGLDFGQPEFQVFFNDHRTNDFNTLFISLPSDRRYFAAGMPGSFHGRLFPKASLHFVHSSFALHWLSEVPGEVLDQNSPAFNEGRTFYVGAPKEVIDAYSAQLAKDMEHFLSARAQEMVAGGLMAITIGCRPSGSRPEDFPLAFLFHQLECCLNDMGDEGLVNKDAVDSFNFPVYIPSASQVKEVVERNGCFSIEGMEILYQPSNVGDPSSARIISRHFRAATEGLISKHFGDQIVDGVFEIYSKKLEELSKSSSVAKYEMSEDLLLLVKRIEN